MSISLDQFKHQVAAIIRDNSLPVNDYEAMILIYYHNQITSGKMDTITAAQRAASDIVDNVAGNNYHELLKKLMTILNNLAPNGKTQEALVKLIVAALDLQEAPTLRR
jgi:hypothetical protein